MIIALMNTIGMIAIIAAMIIILFNSKYKYDVHIRVVLMGILLVAAFRFFSSILEWSQMTNYFDVFEDNLGILEPMMWVFIFIAFLQYRNREDLKQKNFELETLIYAISHDVKTPITSIEWFVDSLRQGGLSSGKIDGEDEHCFNRIKMNLRHVDELIKNILQLSRVGLKDDKKEVLLVSDIFDEMINRYGEEAKAKNIDLRKNAESCCRINVTVQFYQALDNLVNNAIKFYDSSKISFIELSCECSKDKVYIKVRDNGIGINEQYHKKIFEVFERLGTEKEGVKGTGIGLTLVRRIVEVNNGRIYLVSEEGAGSEFIIELSMVGKSKAVKPERRK